MLISYPLRFRFALRHKHTLVLRQIFKVLAQFRADWLQIMRKFEQQKTTR